MFRYNKDGNVLRFAQRGELLERERVRGEKERYREREKVDKIQLPKKGTENGYRKIVTRKVTLLLSRQSRCFIEICCANIKKKFYII